MDRGLSRRNILRGGLVAGLAIAAPGLLAACAPTASSSGPRTISVWTWYGNQGRPNDTPLGPAYTKAHPDVKVDIRTFGSTNDYTPALASAVSAKQTPDIFGPSFSAIEYGKQGVALDLRQALGSDFLDQFFQADNDQFSSGGKQYGIGWNAQSFGMFFQPATLAKIGVEAPETWAALIKMAPDIKKAGYIPLTMPASPSYGLSDFWCPLVTQASNDPTLLLKIDALEDGKDFTDDAVVAAFDQFQKIVKGGVFDDGLLAVTYPIAEQLIQTDKTAFLWDGSWVPAGFATSAPDIRYDVAPNPAWESGAKHWTADQAGAALSVSATSAHVDDAINFLKFIFDPQQYSDALNAVSAMPATKAAAEKVSDPKIKKMTSWLTDGLGAPHILYGAGSVSGISDACVAIVQGESSPKEAAATVQAAVAAARKK